MGPVPPPEAIAVPDRRYRVIRDPEYGYLRLDPVPDEAELAAFYQSRYYDLIRQGGRAPELKRFMEGGSSSELERTWLRSTVYADVAHVLKEHGTGRRILDVGCGTGEALLALREHGFECFGIEPSEEAAALAASQGLSVYGEDLDGFVAAGAHGAAPFDAILLLSVLEHVPRPADVLRHAYTLLAPGGIVVGRVPNDFNQLQLAAHRVLDKHAWWIATPDHINYFDFASLRQLLGAIGFEVVYAQGDFPMELFLLLGDDYVGHPDVGMACHEKRVRFELSIDGAYRRRLYQALGAVGASRDCLVFGQRPAS